MENIINENMESALAVLRENERLEFRKSWAILSEHERLEFHKSWDAKFQREVDAWSNGSMGLDNVQVDYRFVSKIGECDHCLEVNRNLTPGHDSFGVHVVDVCAFGCNDNRSINTGECEEMKIPHSFGEESCGYCGSSDDPNVICAKCFPK